jgi:hypothetical protein
MLRGKASTGQGEVEFEFALKGKAPSKPRPSSFFQIRQEGIAAESDEMARDLVEIAAAVNLADRFVRRSVRSGHRTRIFTLEVPVSDERRWKAVAAEVEELAGFASQDLWRLRFTRRPRDRRPEAATNPVCEVVALFSGGLDSLCGAAHLAQRDKQTLLLTHSPPGFDRVRQMIAALNPSNPEAFQYASISIAPEQHDRAGRRTRFQEFTRRTRPFLYLSLASAAAIVTGAHEVQMSENGALGASLPFRRSHHGPRITRQGHSLIMEGFERLLSDIRPGATPIRFVNPFRSSTKGEVCAQLALDPRAAYLTLSCEYAGQQVARLRGYFANDATVARGPTTARQCGLCVPCIVRRSALRRAGIRDGRSDYFFDAAAVLRRKPARGSNVNESAPLFRFASVHPFYAHRFATEMLSMDLSAFSATFFNELSYLRPRIRSRSDLAEVLDLQRRFAHELLELLNG